MEVLYQAHSLFVADQFSEAIPLYENASKNESTASEALTSLANIYLKLGNLQLALSKSEEAIQIDPNNYLAYLRKAQSLFFNQQFALAKEAFMHADLLKSNIASTWILKCDSELRNTITKEVFTWFQSNEDVFVIFFVKTNSAEDVRIEIEPNRLSIKAKSLSGADFVSEIKLARNIVPENSSYVVKGNKVEVTLKKAEIVNWTSLEPIKNVESRPSYPSSSKKNINWDKLDKEIEQELKKEKPEGEAAMNDLFKQIYENADEDTRRAMIKSYQTSGGTVLSTNWKEVRDKDYEGKDRPDPPKGQEWAKPS